MNGRGGGMLWWNTDARLWVAQIGTGVFSCGRLPQSSVCVCVCTLMCFPSAAPRLQPSSAPFSPVQYFSGASVCRISWGSC